MTAVRTVGSLLPADILAAALDGSLPGMTGADYHLAAGETPRQAASRSWTYLQGVYRSYRDELAKLPAGQTGTALTREKWLQILLRELDYGRVPTTPGGHLAVGGKEYPISHLWADVPMHLLGWGIDLDSRTEKAAGAATRPAVDGAGVPQPLRRPPVGDAVQRPPTAAAARQHRPRRPGLRRVRPRNHLRRGVVHRLRPHVAGLPAVPPGTPARPPRRGRGTHARGRSPTGGWNAGAPTPSKPAPAPWPSFATR